MEEKKKHKIKVQIADTFKRESVLIDIQGRQLARGKNKMQLIKDVYGR